MNAPTPKSPATGTTLDQARKGKLRKDLLQPWMEAQRLAFGPLLFHAVAVARDRGLIARVEQAGDAGITARQVSADLGVPLYDAVVLLDGCVAAGAMDEENEVYTLTRMGSLVQNDAMTRVNMDFSRDVCDRAMGHLAEALDEDRAAGLSELVEGKTVYEALARLPALARKSWLAFDHFYSDKVFPLALPKVLARKPRRVLDVGGNTGKWALMVAPHVPVTILDHPGQIRDALANAKAAGLEGRVTGVGLDLLADERAYPTDFDVVWMSQFLVCFSPAEIVSLFRRAKGALSPEGRVVVVDTFIDRQHNEVGKACLTASSLYFTTVANGNSRMYRFGDYVDYAGQAGLVVESEEPLGTDHTWMVLKPR